MRTLNDYPYRDASQRMDSDKYPTTSHQLRTFLTPLTAAIGLLRIGKLDPRSPKGQRLLEIASTNVERFLRLVSAIEADERLGDLARQRLASFLWLESDLRQAMQQDELQLHYQPIYALPNPKLVGFEALLRWHHPQQGWISPIDFVSIAEETDLIHDLGEWVLWRACQQISLWQTYKNDLHISVNLSPKQLGLAQFGQRVQQILTETGCSPLSLRIEVTESGAMQDSAIAKATLLQLKVAGIQVHLDDFGTGYSSLSYLQDLPVDALKIDRSFIHQGQWDIVQIVLMLAERLNKHVIAEGVETNEQLEQLQRLGCPQAQGYLFSRPLPEADATQLLLRDRF